MQNEARLVAAGVVAVILSGVLWFLWELVKAPFKLDRDKTQRISAMRRLLVRDETESEIRAQLLGFYQEGMGFFSDPIFRRTEIDMREWAERVSQFLHLHYDDTDAFTFDNADGPPKKVIAPVDSFRNKLDVLHMMLRGTHSKSYWAQRDLGEDVT